MTKVRGRTERVLSRRRSRGVFPSGVGGWSRCRRLRGRGEGDGGAVGAAGFLLGWGIRLLTKWGRCRPGGLLLRGEACGPGLGGSGSARSSPLVGMSGRGEPPAKLNVLTRRGAGRCNGLTTAKAGPLSPQPGVKGSSPRLGWPGSPRARGEPSAAERVPCRHSLS